MSATNLTAVPDKTGFAPGRWMGRAVAFVVAGFFVIFFALPIVWLLLAPTKTARQLLLDNPFSFGSFDALADRKSTRLNSSHSDRSRMPSSA